MITLFGKGVGRKEFIQINGFKNLRNGQEDYDCWKRALAYTNCAYVSMPLFYYDNSHGGGRKY